MGALWAPQRAPASTGPWAAPGIRGLQWGGAAQGGSPALLRCGAAGRPLPCARRVLRGGSWRRGGDAAVSVPGMLRLQISYLRQQLNSLASSPGWQLLNPFLPPLCWEQAGLSARRRRAAGSLRHRGCDLPVQAAAAAGPDPLPTCLREGTKRFSSLGRLPLTLLLHPVLLHEAQRRGCTRCRCQQLLARHSQQWGSAPAWLLSAAEPQLCHIPLHPVGLRWGRRGRGSRSPLAPSPRREPSARLLRLRPPSTECSRAASGADLLPLAEGLKASWCLGRFQGFQSPLEVLHRPHPPPPYNMWELGSWDGTRLLEPPGGCPPTAVLLLPAAGDAQRLCLHPQHGLCSGLGPHGRVCSHPTKPGAA